MTSSKLDAGTAPLAHLLQGLGELPAAQFCSIKMLKRRVSGVQATKLCIVGFIRMQTWSSGRRLPREAGFERAFVSVRMAVCSFSRREHASHGSLNNSLGHGPLVVQQRHEIEWLANLNSVKLLS